MNLHIVVKCVFFIFIPILVKSQNLTIKSQSIKIRSEKNFLMLENLCLSHSDSLNFTISHEFSNSGILTMFLIPDPGWDTTDLEEEFVHPQRTCERQVEFLGADTTKKQILELSTDSEDSGCQIKNGTITCTVERVFHMSKTRWWYLALANCNSTTGLEFEYSLATSSAQSRDRNETTCGKGGRPLVHSGRWTFREEGLISEANGVSLSKVMVMSIFIAGFTKVFSCV